MKVIKHAVCLDLRAFVWTTAMKEGRFPALFVADAVGIDFLNSAANPTEGRPDAIATGQQFLDWLARAGLVPDEVRAYFQGASGPAELEAVAEQARSLREWFRSFVLAYKGKPLSVSVVDELGPLNGILRRDEGFEEVIARLSNPGDGNGPQLMCASRGRWRSLDSLLGPIARSFADLICTDDFTYIKACEGIGCNLVFIDRTRGHARRWCRMATCGNRAKVQAHRDRHRLRCGANGPI
jgi:predicted RNA-binding Zn ribbon-like protein